MDYRRLGKTDLRVSVLGLGASPFGGVFGVADPGQAARTVHLALDHGVNFIDVAPCYGDTRAETVLGAALRGVVRDRYLLATKVGQYREGEFDFSAARVTRSVEESCRRLGVEHVDLLQCHDIEFADLNQVIEETLPALLRLRERGVARHLGITGYPLKGLRQAAAASPPEGFKTVLSFCRHTLNDDALADALPCFEAYGLGVINASPTAMGLFTPGGPPPWHPAPPALQVAAREAVAACACRGDDIVRCALQFSLREPRIATTLVGTADPAQMAQNLAHAVAPIDHDAIARVLADLAPVRRLNFMRGRPENRDW